MSLFLIVNVTVVLSLTQYHFHSQSTATAVVDDGTQPAVPPKGPGRRWRCWLVPSRRYRPRSWFTGASRRRHATGSATEGAGHSGSDAGWYSASGAAQGSWFTRVSRRRNAAGRATERAGRDAAADEGTSRRNRSLRGGVNDCEKGGRESQISPFFVVGYARS